jgi:hypothetical protein
MFVQSEHAFLSPRQVRELESARQGDESSWLAMLSEARSDRDTLAQQAQQLAEQLAAAAKRASAGDAARHVVELGLQKVKALQV